MNKHLSARDLPKAHTPKAIAARLASATAHSYLGDFALGGIDGVVTTFAIVSCAAGAGWSNGIALVMGVANLLADGLSMAAGNFVSTKSERQVVDHVRRVEERHIEEFPDGEREEIRQIYSSKGFTGEVLEEVVDVITEDRKRWVDTMVTEEFGLQLETPSPIRAALATFAAFVLAGLVPIAPYCLPHIDGNFAFRISTAATGITFLLIGMGKGHVVGRSKLFSGLEVFVIGAAAATVAYLVGNFLEGITGA